MIHWLHLKCAIMHGMFIAIMLRGDYHDYAWGLSFSIQVIIKFTCFAWGHLIVFCILQDAYMDKSV